MEQSASQISSRSRIFQARNSEQLVIEFVARHASFM